MTKQSVILLIIIVYFDAQVSKTEFFTQISVNLMYQGLWSIITPSPIVFLNFN